MNTLTSILAVIFILCWSACLHAEDDYQNGVFATLDADKNGILTCDELAEYLKNQLIARLRGAGLEPKSSSRVVPPCAERERGPDTNPEWHFSEYLRELVQAALNTGRVQDPSSITLRELTLLE